MDGEGERKKVAIELRELFGVTVRAVVQDKKQGTLLAKEDFEGTWETPGGRLEAGEGVLEGLKRIMQEKTGLNVFPEGVIDFTVGKKPGKKQSHLHILFKCRTGGEKKSKAMEGVRTKWFSAKELQRLLDDKKADWHDERVFAQIL